jgi:hypothetical protein
MNCHLRWVCYLLGVLVEGTKINSSSYSVANLLY